MLKHLKWWLLILVAAIEKYSEDTSQHDDMTIVVIKLL